MFSVRRVQSAFHNPGFAPTDSTNCRPEILEKKIAVVLNKYELLFSCYCSPDDAVNQLSMTVML